MLIIYNIHNLNRRDNSGQPLHVSDLIEKPTIILAGKIYKDIQKNNAQFIVERVEQL